jgi:hypothetical protein
MAKKKVKPVEEKIEVKEVKPKINLKKEVEEMTAFVEREIEKLRNISFGDKKIIDKDIAYEEGKLAILKRILTLI